MLPFICSKNNVRRKLREKENWHSSFLLPVQTTCELWWTSLYGFMIFSSTVLWIFLQRHSANARSAHIYHSVPPHVG